MPEATGAAVASPPAKPGRKRRRIGLALAAGAALLSAAGWCHFNGLPLPLTARDRAALVTARDLEPWVPGVSALGGTESYRKRVNFFRPEGTDIDYRYENLQSKAPVAILSKVAAIPT